MGENARRTRVAWRGGFTLMESLMAATVLGIIVVAVASAMTSSYQMAFEGQKLVLASLAGDDLMSELSTLSSDDLWAHDGRHEGVGEMETLDGEAYPGAFWALGREVEVTPTTIEAGGEVIEGVTVFVGVFDEHGVVLAQAEMFVGDEVTP